MSTIELIDCHTHTSYSGHGNGTVHDVVNAALNKGVSTLVLTEHLPMPEGVDPYNSFSMNTSIAEQYKLDVLSARDSHPDITLILGGEADWLGTNERFLCDTTHEYEYLLGSVHFIDGWAFDNPDELAVWDERDVDEVWTRYFSLWCDAVTSAVPFDCMAHPDLPKKFGHRPSFDTRELFAEVARVAAARQVMVEVNTAGLRRPVKEVYPSQGLLNAFYEAGVDCTFGSDAHAPSEVAFGAKEAYRAMYQAGYRRVTVPLRDKQRRYISLEGAWV
ncbi:MAG: histidinol-phosphatase HisJ family protein [Actinobacteria bacterium]|nr:histidinol-phosphatase HisJ family protein [Actinomycetota bacterium]